MPQRQKIKMKLKNMVSASSQSQSLPWDVVEKAIKREMDWLRNVIDTFSDEEKNTPITCRECLIRKIAILIVSGKVKTTEITKSPLLRSFWINESKITRKNNKKKIHHGQLWHRKTMKKIESYFLSQGYEVIREPNLHWGRADLGVFKKNKQDLYIEVGTTSFFKIWMNLETMKNFIYLIVPSDNRLIEFISLGE
jgi:hypothetical protein